MSDATLITELADCRQCYDALTAKHTTLLAQRDSLKAQVSELRSALIDARVALLSGSGRCARTLPIIDAAIALAGGGK